MKKKALVLYGWIIFSILFQVLAYTFVDRVVLRNRENIGNELNVKPLDTTVLKETDKIVSIDIPTGAKDVKVSYDGNYAAYLLDNKLYIVDVNTKESKKVFDNFFINKDNTVSKTESKISVFKWIPYKNMIMFAMSNTSNTATKGQVYTYDLETGNLHVSKTVLADNYIPRGGEISDIIISPFTMVYYIRVSGGQSNDRFYRVDIMDDFYTSVNLLGTSTAKIGFYSEDLYYTEGEQKITVKSGLKSPVILTMPSNQVLLGIGGTSKEAKDIIYSGVLNSEGKVEKIIYGNQSTNPSEWKSINVDKPLPKEQFVIKDEEKVYSIGSDNNVTELVSGKKISFSGQFIDVTDTQIAYLSDGKLNLKTIKN